MSSDVPWVQAYTADELSRPGVAIEPMTCPPNAFNSGEDLIALKVGQTHSFTYRSTRRTERARALAEPQ